MVEKKGGRAMNEQEFGRRIRVELDSGLDRLDERVKARLTSARQTALLSIRPGARTVTGLAVVDGWLARRDRHPGYVFSGLVLAFFLAGAWMSMPADNVEDDIDAILLADDLPVQAYVDHRFDRWLGR